MAQLTTSNLTRQSLPGVPFTKIAKSLLPGWDLSLVFVTPKEAQKLNKSLRGKIYVPNVLSYSPSSKSGEVIICLSIAKVQAPEYGLSYSQFVALLFIHALLHLKGSRHGTTMEKRERALLARFVPIHATKNRSGNRHRKPSSKGGDSRGGARQRRSRS